MTKYINILLLSLASYSLAQSYCDNCPKVDAICKKDDKSYLPTDESAPPCWVYFKGIWGCGDKTSEGECDISIKYIDITDCEYESESEPTPPIPTPSRCPKVEAICKTDDGEVSPNDDDAPPCWIFYKGMWGCGDKVNGKCESNRFMDITDCEYY